MLLFIIIYDIKGVKFKNQKTDFLAKNLNFEIKFYKKGRDQKSHLLL